MKKALFFTSQPNEVKKLFASGTLGEVDGRTDELMQLKIQFAAQGIDLVASDLNSSEDFEFYLFSDMPKVDLTKINPEKSYLMIMETDIIRPDNWVMSNHKYFKKIFTWNNDLVDDKKYFKHNFSRAGKTDFLSFKERKKLCTLISGNKAVDHPLELYSLRLDLIHFFENKSEDFDFYGMGWDRFYFRGPRFIRALNRITALQKFLAPKFKTYKGMVDRKLDVLKQYKFSICFENGKEIPGYITEKIFDSLAAGCVPVYYGAPDVTRHIPKDCFIDYRDFASKDDLYNYMKNMSEAEFNQYIESINKYLASEQFKEFSPEFNAAVVVKEILK